VCRLSSACCTGRSPAGQPAATRWGRAEGLRGLEGPPLPCSFCPSESNYAVPLSNYAGWRNRRRHLRMLCSGCHGLPRQRTSGTPSGAAPCCCTRTREATRSSSRSSATPTTSSQKRCDCLLRVFPAPSRRRRTACVLRPRTDPLVVLGWWTCCCCCCCLVGWMAPSGSPSSL
jgi:hypothetical protein